MTAASAGCEDPNVRLLSWLLLTRCHLTRAQHRPRTLLQAGVVAAFGLVRGLGQASGILTAGPGTADAVAGLDLSVASLGSAGLALGQCMLAAAFAATAVEAGFLQGLVKPFGAAGGGADGDSSR